MVEIQAPPFSASYICARAASLVERFINLKGTSYFVKNGLSFGEMFEEVIYPEYEVRLVEGDELGFDDSGKKILGYYEVMDNVVHIDACLHPERRDARRTFTLWHEVAGHAVLQGEWLRQQLESSTGAVDLITTDASFSPNAVQRIERQANLFAGNVAAPMWLMNTVLARELELTRKLVFRGPGTYHFGSRRSCCRVEVISFEGFCQSIARCIQGFFGGLSAESLGYRIACSGWVEDRSRKSLRLMRVA